MPLEDLTGNAYINALVNTNPTSDDDRSEGDNHIRGVKNVLVKSFPQISGPVAAGHADLSACAGASSDFQPQIDGLDGRVTQNEQDIADLQIGGGSLPPVSGKLWTDETNITASYPGNYQLASGSSLVIPSAWGVGTVKVDISVNILLTSDTLGGGHLLMSDLAIFLDNASIAEFASVLGTEGETAAGRALQLQNLVNISLLVAATGGQSIDVRARRGFGNQGNVKINNFGVASYLSIMRADFQT